MSALESVMMWKGETAAQLQVADVDEAHTGNHSPALGELQWQWQNGDVTGSLFFNLLTTCSCALQ